MKKNLKQWIMPLILIFFIPHLINLVTGYMMNEKQLKDIPMAVYMEDQTSLTRKIVKSFDDTETFEIVKYADSPEEVERSMAVGEALYGLVIPKDFTKDLKKYKSPTIVSLVDGTQLSSAAFTRIQGTEILLTTKIGAMVNAFKGKFDLSSKEALHMASPISITSRILGNPTRNYINFLMPGLMAALIQVGMVMTTASVTSPESLGAKEFRLDYLKKLMGYASAGTLSILMMVGVQTRFFSVPFRGGMGKLALLTFVFSCSVVSICMMLSTVFFKNKVFASQVAAVYFIPSSIIGGYTWPLVAMPEPIQKFATLMPFTYFGNFLRMWLLDGHYSKYSFSLLVLSLMVGVSTLTSFLVQKILGSKVVKEAMVLEH